MAPRPATAEQQLQRHLGRRFRRPELLLQALTHSSWARDQAAAAPDNERLEFLGDAVLGLRVCERLSAAFPASSEGQLSRMRAWLVSARHLAEAARQLGLGPHLRLSKAEERIGGRDKPRLLANALEAVIAAIHVDGGYAAAARFIDAHVIGASLETLSPEQLHEFAYKSALQEWAHARGRAAPQYRVLAEEGPEHDKRFTVEVLLPGSLAERGSAGSKKAAEQAAARQALERLGLLPGER